MGETGRRRGGAEQARRHKAAATTEIPRWSRVRGWLPLRSRAFPGSCRSVTGLRVQLLDLHEEGHPASTVPREDFELLRGDEALTTYQFNTNTAKHIFCKYCGIHSFYVPRLHPDRISVNARCLAQRRKPTINSLRVRQRTV